MRSTTIKLEGELLRDLEAVKPREESLSSYVRSVLKRDINRQKVREAAVAYNAFVKDHNEERAWLEEWDRADLSTPVEPGPNPAS